jgi:hypothetical protein
MRAALLLEERCKGGAMHLTSLKATEAAEVGQSVRPVLPGREPPAKN